MAAKKATGARKAPAKSAARTHTVGSKTPAAAQVEASEGVDLNTHHADGRLRRPIWEGGETRQQYLERLDAYNSQRNERRGS